MATAADGTERVFQKLLNSEVVLCTKMILQNSKIDELHRRVIYNEGWNDERVLEMLRRVPGRDKLKITHVIDFRRENFGHLESEAATRAKAPVAQPGYGELVLRVAKLESDLATIKQRLSQ